VRHKIALQLGLAVLSCIGAGAASAEPLRMPPTIVGDLLPPYEIATIVRSAGLDPVSRPMLQGRRYVLRAIDPDGIDVRVLVDARFGEIVAVQPFYEPGRAPPRVLAAPGYERGPRIVAVPRDEGWIDRDDIPAPRPPRVVPSPVPAPGMSGPVPGPNAPATAPLTSRAPEAGAATARAPLPRARPAPVKSAKAALPPAAKPADAPEHTGSIRVPDEAQKAAEPKADGPVAAKVDSAPAAAAPAATDGAAAKTDTPPPPAAAAAKPTSPAMPPVAPLEE
jgi:hypothetical protein